MAAESLSWTRRTRRHGALARRSAPITLAETGQRVRGAPRISATRKQSAVLRLLRGEDLELLSRELSVPAAELSAWRNAFLAAGAIVHGLEAAGRTCRT